MPMTFKDVLSKTKGHAGGWLTQKDCNWLSFFLSSLEYDYKPEIAELGVFQGGSSLIFLACQPNCNFHAIDNWQGGPPSPPWTNIKQGFLSITKDYKDQITIHSGNSKQIGYDWKTPLDICLIDGCHNGEYPAIDIDNFSKWIKPRGYLLIDDYQMKDVKKATDEKLIGNPKWKTIASVGRETDQMVGFQRI